MDNKYQDKLEEHINNMSRLMFTFEVTKACGYSAFITIYRENTLLNLYETVIDHFQISEIKELFFYSPSGQKILIPISKQRIDKFIQINTTNNPVNLVPIYPLPRPIVYRIYLDDGH